MTNGKPIVHESHNMRRFSDIPWGCWFCGACICHHAADLDKPCPKAIKKSHN